MTVALRKSKPSALIDRVQSCWSEACVSIPLLWGNSKSSFSTLFHLFSLTL